MSSLATLIGHVHRNSKNQLACQVDNAVSMSRAAALGCRARVSHSVGRSTGHRRARVWLTINSDRSASLRRLKRLKSLPATPHNIAINGARDAQAELWSELMGLREAVKGVLPSKSKASMS